MDFHDVATYLNYLKETQTTPVGFRFAVTSIRFQPRELETDEPVPMNIALIGIDGPRPVAVGRTTRNRFPGAPVLLTRRRLKGGRASAVIINNKVSNVASPTGMEDAVRLTAAVADQLGVPREEVYSASTGIIGWRLPVADMERGVPTVARELGQYQPLDVAQAIMTTDAYPKLRVRKFRNRTILGIAKGAGMIEPNMGTMLAFVMTDIGISREQFDRVLGSVVEQTFNRVTVDGDQSTSDIVLGLSSGVAGEVLETQADVAAFQKELLALCTELAIDIVRNGEGIRHVMEICVSGTPDDALALEVCRAVGNSPLVKTAVFGNDPNVGRILSAAGDCLGQSRHPEAFSLPLDKLRITIGSQTVYSDEQFQLSPEKEGILSEMLESAMSPEPATEQATGYPARDKTVPITLDFGYGPGYGRIWAGDLTYGYVRENADYRT